MDSPPAKSPPPPQSDILIPSLPDDVAIQCLARVPRLYHPFLALVCRRWRALLRSPQLFSVRRHIGATQHFLFINLYVVKNVKKEILLWFQLPDRRRLNHHSPPLIPLPEQPYPSAIKSTPVALGHNLFLLGGLIDYSPSSVVQIYDARLNSWRLGPPMLAPRVSIAAGVISGRIYVVSSAYLNECSAEEFDPETERWRWISSTTTIQRRNRWYGVLGERLLEAASKGVFFDPRKNEWTSMPVSMCSGFKGLTTMVGDILFSIRYPRIVNAFDLTTEDGWGMVELEGLDGILPRFPCGAKLCNLGEFLCVLWESWRKNDEFEVVCEGVRVTKMNTGGLHGLVEWVERCSLSLQSGLISDSISLEF